MLQSIQASRGIAAIFVLLYHLNNIVFGSTKYFPIKPFGAVFDIGHIGVDFFFTLSGFIIKYVHCKDIGHADAVPRYLRRRFDRIFPTYWAVLAILTAAFAASPSMGLGHEREPLTMFSSTFLLYTNGNMILGPAWTLCHEVAFYALFLGLIVRPRIAAPAMAAWAAAIILIDPWRGDLAPALHFLASPFNLLFLMGVLAALATQKGVRAAPLVVALGVVLLLTSGFGEPYSGRPYDAELSWRLINGSASACIIIGLVGSERHYRFAVPRALSFLGEASYAIYLTHYPVMIALGKAALRIDAPAWMLFTAMAAATLAAGVAFHIIVERPLLRWLRERPAKPRSPSGSAVA